jgi:glycogen phosphorylase
LYELLEEKVIPEFYTRDDSGIPLAWVARIRESMARLTPRFSANRTVREYTDKYYVPAATAYRNRAADQGALGQQIVSWQQALERNWSNLRFGQVEFVNDGNNHIFEAQVHFNGLDPNAVRVEVYADGVDGGEPAQHEMRRGHKLVGTENGYTYYVEVAATRPATDYTVRAIPQHLGVSVPLEAAQVLWQR